MTLPFLLFSLVGLGFFYLQSLLFLPHVRLRLLPLLIFAVGLRPSLPLALSLAVILGLLQDSYATTPFGLHVAASLGLVAIARFCRRRLELQKLGPQVLASLGALALQEVILRVALVLTGSRNYLVGGLVLSRGLEILATAALAPLMFPLVKGLEKFLGRFGWRPHGESTSFHPLP
jgi:rod shape-determining protein MreD